MTSTITHLGHACVLVETARARVLIDPGTMSSFAHLRDLDAVLVTHQHADHIDANNLSALMLANPRAKLVVDDDTAEVTPELSNVTVAREGDRLTIAGCAIDAVGGLHAPVYGAAPGCANRGYVIDDGAFFHPGDSFHVPPHDVDVLAVAIDGPWLKLAEAVEYVAAVVPRVAVPIHEGETTDPAKYVGMLAAFSAAGVVRPLPLGTAVGV